MLKSSLAKKEGMKESPRMRLWKEELIGSLQSKDIWEVHHLFPSFDACEPDLRSCVKYAVPMAASSSSQTNKSQDTITLY